MGKFTKGLQNAAKVKNHKRGMPGKIALRRKLLEEIGADKASVFDAFAGSGVMWREVWHEAVDYVGCDLEWHEWYKHKAFCADNRRVLRCISLNRFNIFDLDAFGSPWEQGAIIAARRKLGKGELIGFGLTDGSAMRARTGKVDWKLAQLSGVDVDMSGAHREWPALTRRAMSEIASRMGGTLVDIWSADSGGRAMSYSAALLKGG
jgi:hypothetical protein